MNHGETALSFFLFDIFPRFLIKVLEPTEKNIKNDTTPKITGNKMKFDTNSLYLGSFKLNVFKVP